MNDDRAPESRTGSTSTEAPLVMHGPTVVRPRRWNRMPTVLLTGALLSLAACGAPGADVAAPPTPSSSSSSVPPSPTAVSPSPTHSTPAPSPSAPLKKARSLYWQSLKPGMCVVEPDEEEAVEVTVTDCRAEHHVEVTLRTTLPGDRTWPGDDAVDTAATRSCEEAFAKYVGIPYDESRLDVTYLTTLRDGWEDGDRRLICMVYDPEEETTAVPLKGSKQ